MNARTGSHRSQLRDRYPILQSQDIERLQQLVHVYQNKARFQAPAFV
ncbi:hypothetical protein IQ272_32980 [Chroococcidiopsidales cyanobacterium LEGE 13417]|nr:hypothetical protein [Chroococcidiopsidales cyanobacterium LEGE 13417]